MHAGRLASPSFVVRRVLMAVVGAAALGLPGACAQTPNRPLRDPQTISTTPVRDPVVGRSTFESPIEISGQSTVMVPFSITSEKGWFDNDDQFRDPDGTRSRGYAAASVSRQLADGGSGLRRVRWHNVVFRTLQSGEERTLLDQRGVISGYMTCTNPYVHDGIREEGLTHALVFLVTTRDTNRNGALDAGDAQVLVMTGPGGENAHVITPDGVAVTKVRYPGWAAKVLIELRTDTSDDGKIDFDDEPSQWVCDIPDGTAKPLISPETAAKVRAILK